MKSARSLSWQFRYKYPHKEGGKVFCATAIKAVGMEMVKCHVLTNQQRLKTLIIPRAAGTFSN